MAKYITNKHGAVHSIPDDWHIRPDWRIATPEEIAKWRAAQGLDVIAEVINGKEQHGQTNRVRKRADR